jgi:hypothetical protein
MFLYQTFHCSPQQWETSVHLLHQKSKQLKENQKRKEGSLTPFCLIISQGCDFICVEVKLRTDDMACQQRKVFLPARRHLLRQSNHKIQVIWK